MNAEIHTITGIDGTFVSVGRIAEKVLGVEADHTGDLVPVSEPITGARFGLTIANADPELLLAILELVESKRGRITIKRS